MTSAYGREGVIHSSRSSRSDSTMSNSPFANTPSVTFVMFAHAPPTAPLGVAVSVLSRLSIESDKPKCAEPVQSERLKRASRTPQRLPLSSANRWVRRMDACPRRHAFRSLRYFKILPEPGNRRGGRRPDAERPAVGVSGGGGHATVAPHNRNVRRHRLNRRHRRPCRVGDLRDHPGGEPLPPSARRRRGHRAGRRVGPPL